MMRRILFLAIFFTTFFEVSAQSYAFGVKGGLLLGVQQWNAFEQDPLFKYHGIVFIESAEETNKFSVFAQLGYHSKGSAIRSRNFTDRFTGETFRPDTREFLFNNLGLTIGGKQKHDLENGGKTKLYYYFGLRGDYTLFTNLKDYKELNERTGSLFYPDDQFVQKLNYGATVGGGFEFPFNDLMGGILEFSVNPDFSFQYRQPAATVWDPFTQNNRSIGERTIRNITFEVTLGIRLLHIIEYID